MQVSHHYINGKWLLGMGKKIPIVNPSTELEIARVPSGTLDEINQAVLAAKIALPAFRQTLIEERIIHIEKV